MSQKLDALQLDNYGDTVTTVTDANGNIRTETVDAAGLTKETKDIDSGSDASLSTKYIYDSLGRKTTEEYGDGSYVTYSYAGESSRITESKAYKAGGTLESTVSYSYDSYGRTSAIVCKDSSGTEICKTEYTRDAEGKVLTESRTYSGKSKQVVTYSYDSEGRISSKIYPSSTGLGTINYQYDSLGGCTKISKGSSTAREYVYDSLGRVSSIKDYDKPGSSSFIETNYTYDSHGRAVSMVSENDGSASAVLESHTYTYDKNSNIKTYAHVNNLPASGKKIDEERTYTYNSHGYLTKSVKTDNLTDTAETTEYTYDAVGNRKTETARGVKSVYSYNGLNQLEEVTSGDTVINYSYDDRGNQIEEVTSTLSGSEGSETSAAGKTVTTEYAVTGEMIRLTEKTGSTTTLTQTNVYDHNGQRISRTQNGTTRSYYYDNGVVVFTEDGSSMSGANILTDSGAVAGSYRGSTYHNYLTDMQGSTTSIVKEDGSLSAAYIYTDFGETTEVTGGTFDNQICYTGGIYDKETGLYYLNARYYDPETGRFISQDTYRGEMDDPGQWHLYAYCANNPINYTDPSGHNPIALGLGLGAGFAETAAAAGVVVKIGAVAWLSIEYLSEVKKKLKKTYYYKATINDGEVVFRGKLTKKEAVKRLKNKKDVLATTAKKAKKVCKAASPVNLAQYDGAHEKKCGYMKHYHPVKNKKKNKAGKYINRIEVHCFYQ